MTKEDIISLIIFLNDKADPVYKKETTQAVERALEKIKSKKPIAWKNPFNIEKKYII